MELLDRNKERSDGDVPVATRPTSSGRPCACNYRNLSPIEKGGVGFGILVLIAVIVVLIISALEEEEPDVNDYWGPCDDNFAELYNWRWWYYKWYMIDEFKLNLTNPSYEYKYQLCFYHLTEDIGYVHNNDDELVFSAQNFTHCQDYCRKNVFGFTDKNIGTDSAENDWYNFSVVPDDEYWDTIWKEHYVYFNEEDYQCYCQGYFNATGVVNSNQVWWWSGDEIYKLWRIWEYKVSYVDGIGGGSSNGTTPAPRKVIDSVTIKGDAGDYCDIDAGDQWINYTDLDSLNISYWVYETYACAEGGRPYVVDGTDIKANSKSYQQCSVVDGSAVKKDSSSQKLKKQWWSLESGSTNSVEKSGLTLDENERSFVVDSWYNQGLREHASIASFSMNGIRLLSIGAPAYLLEMNYKASLDEIEHTKICLTMSYYYNETTDAGSGSGNNGSGSFLMPSSLDEHSIEIKSDNFENWNNIAIETARHGCIDETISVLLSYYKGMIFNDDSKTEFDFKSLLNQIAVDESRHASFAWNTLKWMQIYKSDKLNVFDEKWWQLELENRIIKLQQGGNEMNNVDEANQFGKFGILSSMEEKKVFLIGLKQLIPKLLKECLLNGETIENLECPAGIIHAFMDNDIYV